MPVLQKMQGIFGYIPKEMVDLAALKLGEYSSQIYGVATFYSQFHLEPKGKYQIGLCMGTACYVKGAGEILNQLEKLLGIKAGETSADGLYSIDATRCIGACGLAPVMTINDKVYGRLVPEDIEVIIASLEQEVEHVNV